ncbi:MAG: ParB/RepB/Spo0J family partition protein [Patescibacteria group bacterium]
MPIGRGLSSLIPPQKETSDGKAPSKNAVVSPQRDETRLDSQPRSSDSRIGNPAHSVSETLSHAPSHPPMDNDNYSPAASSRNAGGNIGPKKISDGDHIFQIEVDKIKPNPFQPRHEFNDEELGNLAQSIREFGIIQPLIVSKVSKETETGTDVEYQLIAGERRLRAAKLAGLERVPAIVKKVDANRIKLEMALIENLQRHNLNPVESAKAYSRLQDEFGLTQKEIGVRVGKSRETVANAMRLLNLPSYIQEALIQNKLNESQARTLLGIESVDEQKRIFENILSRGLTVRAAKSEAHKPEIVDPEAAYWQKRLEEGLGVPVKVMKRGGKGRVAINFYSDEEWHGVIEKLLGPGAE